MLTIALPKGRILKDALDLLQEAGYESPFSIQDSRKLIFTHKDTTFILVKPADVVTYVEHGVADVGIAGKDVLMEEDRDVYELLDLKISPCYIAVAGLPSYQDTGVMTKIATKYPNIALTYFKSKGKQVEIIKLNGSIELAPLINLADQIVDIVSTGTTLKENGLVEYEKIVSITSRLIVNPVSYQMKDERVGNLIERFEKVIEKQKIKG
ncbi:ATP phosphoribosyltransferase [Bacillus carboniphilus]